MAIQIRSAPPYELRLTDKGAETLINGELAYSLYLRKSSRPKSVGGGAVIRYGITEWRDGKGADVKKYSMGLRKAEAIATIKKLTQQRVNEEQ